MLSFDQTIELGKMIYKLEDKLNVKIEPLVVEEDKVTLKVKTIYNTCYIGFNDVKQVDFSLQGTYERAFAVIVYNFFKRS